MTLSIQLIASPVSILKAASVISAGNVILSRNAEFIRIQLTAFSTPNVIWQKTAKIFTYVILNWSH